VTNRHAIPATGPWTRRAAQITSTPRSSSSRTLTELQLLRHRPVPSLVAPLTAALPTTQWASSIALIARATAAPTYPVAGGRSGSSDQSIEKPYHVRRRRGVGPRNWRLTSERRIGYLSITILKCVVRAAGPGAGSAATEAILPTQSPSLRYSRLGQLARWCRVQAVRPRLLAFRFTPDRGNRPYSCGADTFLRWWSRIASEDVNDRRMPSLLQPTSATFVGSGHAALEPPPPSPESLAG
jgi:hypothetical protein